MTPRAALIWAALALTVAIPLVAAANSPLLEWRGPVYVAAGLAGVAGLVLLPIQPLLVVGAVPGVRGRRVHAWVGAGLVAAVALHVAGLWIVSPPDVVDVLLFRSPTPFAVWGAAAMWAVLAAASLAALRPRLRPRVWRLGHTAATTVVVAGTVVHAWLIEGTMETVSKALVCLIALGAMAWAIRRRRVWRAIR